MYDHSLDICFQDGIQYRGTPVLGMSDVMSAEDCQKECQTHIDCQFWTWISPNFRRNKNLCHLKASKGETEAVSGKISGPRTCPGNI